MAAVVVLFVFGLFGGTDYAEDRDLKNPRNNSEEDYLMSFEPGRIGNYNSTTRTLLQKSSMDIEQESPNRTVREFENLEIQNGVFSGEETQTAGFEAGDPNALYVSFTVDSSKTHGDLQLFLNGHVEASFKPEKGKRYTVKMENVSKGENVVMLAAENPGYVFWSPASYSLSNVEVILDDEHVSKNTKTFRAYDYELSSFDVGEVEFFVNEDVKTDSPLMIDINGNRIFERNAFKRSTPYSTSFSKEETNLKQGENTLSIYTGPDSEYAVSNLDIGIKYYQSDRRTTVERSFDIPLHKYQLMDKGQIEYDVENIEVNEPLEISLGNSTFEETPEIGWNTVDITKEDVKNGQNQISISTKGSYEIKDFRITGE